LGSPGSWQVIEECPRFLIMQGQGCSRDPCIGRAKQANRQLGCNLVPHTLLFSCGGCREAASLPAGVRGVPEKLFFFFSARRLRRRAEKKKIGAQGSPSPKKR